MAGGQTGISTYIRELLRVLQVEDSENHYELLMAKCDADLIPVSSPNFSKTIVPSFIDHPLINLAWHNTVLPALGKKI